jgi:hypothetical protein
MTTENQDDVVEEVTYETVAEFLEGTPPNRVIHISDLSEHKTVGGYLRDVMRTPEIQLHCPSDN